MKTAVTMHDDDGVLVGSINTENKVLRAGPFEHFELPPCMPWLSISN